METLDTLTKKVDNSIDSVYTEYQENFDKLVQKRNASTAMLRNLRSLLPRIIEGFAKQNLLVSSLGYHIGNAGQLLSVSISAESNGKFRFIKDRGYTGRGSGKNQKTLNEKAKRIQENFLADTQIEIRVNSMSLEVRTGQIERSVLIDLYL